MIQEILTCTPKGRRDLYDEFMEVFEIAELGKDFELYIEDHFNCKK